MRKLETEHKLISLELPVAVLDRLYEEKFKNKKTRKQIIVEALDLYFNTKTDIK